MARASRGLLLGISIMLCAGVVILGIMTSSRGAEYFYTRESIAGGVTEHSLTTFLAVSTHGEVIVARSEHHGTGGPSEPSHTFRFERKTVASPAHLEGDNAPAFDFDLAEMVLEEVREQTRIRAGFGVFWAGPDEVAMVLPHWFLAALFASPTLVVMAKWTRRHRRQSKGLCVACGYDLRASSGRCPECGHIVPQLASVSKANAE
jgi:hypothetical protein